MIMMIFENGEEAVIQNILSMVGAKARVYDAGFQDGCTLAFSGLVIDELQHIGTRYDAFTFVHPLLIVSFETFERMKYNM